MATRTKRQDAATAYHEAGHAFMAMYEGVRFMRATIEPDGDSAGSVEISKVFRKGEDYYSHSDSKRLRVERRIRVSLAGSVAQRRHDPRSERHRHGQSDRANAFDLASLVVGSDRQAEALNHFLNVQTEDLISQFWPQVTALANALLERRTLSRHECQEIVAAAPPARKEA